jgi:hypothetical protein
MAAGNFLSGKRDRENIGKLSLDLVYVFVLLKTLAMPGTIASFMYFFISDIFPKNQFPAKHNNF